eukprot:CAMPEP_0196638940 /NCGR_PEP_ID=MMETSP1085-20130531/1648_1 /TAXON_ID=41879 ORGANISM="Pycnococcus sp, Strain CCMP1998" /NCGR_SAMPLE_ID=MMETSP1085 /ASSEMBLY_ACC=CAM_ASM_000807 /LENGTH=69 /DNA_ID=CAMNT_0041967871 /DNA_START=85 /DNA_END=291 /DNA_ORIENTATION=+
MNRTPPPRPPDLSLEERPPPQCMLGEGQRGRAALGSQGTPTLAPVPRKGWSLLRLWDLRMADADAAGTP